MTTGRIDCEDHSFVNFFSVPPRLHQLPHANRVQHRRTRLPGGIFHLAVFLVEGVAGGGGLIDEFSNLGFVVECHLHPHVFQGVGDLAEEFMDRLEAFGQNPVHLVFHRVAVTQVGDPDLIAGLADALDASLALLQAGGVPREMGLNQVL